MLSPEEQSRADRFLRDQDRSVYTAAHALLRLMLSQRLPRSPRFRTNAWGKPEVADLAGALQFNLTHTNGLAACAVTDSGPVGVDAEAADRGLDAVPLAESYFSPSEALHVRTRPEPLRTADFLRFWTLKEAFIKAVGKGLSIPLDQFAFTLDPLGFSAAPELSICPEEWCFASESLGSGHQVAVALHLPADGGMTVTHVTITPAALVPLARTYAAANRPGYSGPR